MNDDMLQSDGVKIGGSAVLTFLVSEFWRKMRGNEKKVDIAEEAWRQEMRAMVSSLRDSMAEVKASIASNAKDIASHDKELENLKERIVGQADFYRQQLELIRAEAKGLKSG